MKNADTKVRLAAAVISFVPLVLAQQSAGPYPPEIEGALVEVYKTVGDVRLNLYILTPPGHKVGDRRPAIVFFFGGGWTSGTPRHFEPQARYLASRGMVAILADYRVASRHGVKIPECVRDAKSAVRWVRVNAGRIGVNPNRIAAAGGSAGGHLAASTALLPGFEEEKDDRQISSRPNALVLFNPAVILAPVPGIELRRGGEVIKERAGDDPEAVSPFHHIRAGAPPAIIFHGKADTTVPYETVEAFARKMSEAGNRCELVGYDGAAHGFFNFRNTQEQFYYSTVRNMDEFLVSLGYLKGPPALTEP